MDNTGPTMSWEKPHDYLTAIANLALDSIKGDDVKVIVLVDDDERGGAGVHGYDDPADIAKALMNHAAAVLKANNLTPDDIR